MSFNRLFKSLYQRELLREFQSKDPNFQADDMIELQCEDRWQVYHRLRELEISCWCSCYQPLKVQVSNAVTAIQILSVMLLVNLSQFKLNAVALITTLLLALNSCSGNLSVANLQGADLRRSDLSGAKLYGGYLRWVKLDGATMPDSRIYAFYHKVFLWS